MMKRRWVWHGSAENTASPSRFNKSDLPVKMLLTGRGVSKCLLKDKSDATAVAELGQSLSCYTIS